MILGCDLPECPTPDEDVKRVTIRIDSDVQEIDLCVNDRTTQLGEILRFARSNKKRKLRRRGIQVTQPKSSRPRT